MTSCLKVCLFLLLGCAAVVGLLVYVFFGEPSLFIGFAIGAGSVFAMFSTVFRNPGLAAHTGSRSSEAALASAIISVVIQFSPDPKATALFIARILGWGSTLFFGGLCLVFALFSIALWLEPDPDGSLTVVALLCGATLVSTSYSYKYLARAGRS